MAKLLSCLVLALASVAHASGGEPNDKAGCIMSSTNAVNSIVDSALFMYVTGRNCKNFEDDAAVCVKDLASVVNSATGIAEFLVKAFKSCGEIKTSNYDCAIAGTRLTRSLSSVTANTAAASLDCPSSVKHGGNKKWTYAGADTCNVFIGSAMSSLQSAIASMMAVKGKCQSKHATGETCFVGALDIISAVGSLAVCIENLVSHCSHGATTFNNGCEADITGIIASLTETASIATTIKKTCTVDSSRLYEEDVASKPAASGNANLLTAMLVVFLPIIGFASFSGGSRLAKNRDEVRTTRRIEATV